jgi:hypothetical protein
MNRRRSRLAAGLALLVACPLVGTQAAPSVAAGDVLVSGTLGGNDGQPTQLAVYADTPGVTRPKGMYRQTLIAQSTATDDFRLVVDGETVGLAGLDGGGIVDFTVTARSAGRYGVYMFSRRVGPDGSLLPESAGAQHSGPTPGSAGEFTTSTVTPASNVTVAMQPIAGGSGPAPGSTPAPQSRWCDDRRYLANRPVWIGTAYHNRWGAKQRFTYYVQSTSVLGVGIKIDGGSWGAWGTAERSVGSGNGVWWDTFGRQKQGLITRWGYRRYRCVERIGMEELWSWEVRPERAEGGGERARGLATMRTPARYCRPWSPPGGYLKDETKNINWTNGVKIGSLIGIDLSARSGYSDQTKISTEFTRRMWVCGRFDVPFGQPGQVVYRLRR